MIVYTAFDVAKLHWLRITVDFETGESFARCRVGSSRFVMLPLVLFSVLLSLIDLAIAFKSKAQSDAWWIYTFIAVQIEVGRGTVCV